MKTYDFARSFSKNSLISFFKTQTKRIMSCLPAMVLVSGLIIGNLMANPISVMADGRCPDCQPYEGTTVYETYTYTPISASNWVSTDISLITIYGKLIGGGVWQRVVTYQVTITRKTVSVCYSSRWDRFWAWGGCSKKVTTETLPPTTEQRTQTEIHWPLTGDPPPSTLPPLFEEIHVRCIAIKEVISSSGWALAFPLFSEDDTITALTPSFDFGSEQFANLTNAFANEPGLPPDKVSRFVTDCQNISSGFAQVASALAVEAPTEESLTFLATSLVNFQQDIDSLHIPEYQTATPYLGEAANHLDDMAVQVGLGLDSAEEQIAFLQDLQSLGGSLANSGQSIEEPTGTHVCSVGGIVVPVDKFGLLAPYIGLASTITVAAVATAIYTKRVKRRKEKQ